MTIEEGWNGCQQFSDDIKILVLYCRNEKEGRRKTLEAIIQGAFGHKQDTAQSRIRTLINAEVIAIVGEKWKYIQSNDGVFETEVKKLIELRKNPEQPDDEQRLKEKYANGGFKKDQP